MKLIIEDFLQKIDNYFKNKTKKDIYLIYIMIFSVIFSLSYFTLWDISKKNFKHIKENIETLNYQLNIDHIYLQQNPKSKIIKLEQDIKATKAQMHIHKNNNQYIRTKIKTISFLIYNEIAWGDYLHSISKNAKKYNVKILKLTNEYNLNKKSFGHILDITISLTAKYQDTLKFINSLEQSKLVVDIHDINITTKNKLLTDLSISVWGIAY